MKQRACGRLNAQALADVHFRSGQLNSEASGCNVSVRPCVEHR